jgi:hypothetical protein
MLLGHLHLWIVGRVWHWWAHLQMSMVSMNHLHSGMAQEFDFPMWFFVNIHAFPNYFVKMHGYEDWPTLIPGNLRWVQLIAVQCPMVPRYVRMLCIRIGCYRWWAEYCPDTDASNSALTFRHSSTANGHGGHGDEVARVDWPLPGPSLPSQVWLNVPFAGSPRINIYIYK